MLLGRDRNACWKKLNYMLGRSDIAATLDKRVRQALKVKQRPNLMLRHHTTLPLTLPLDSAGDGVDASDREHAFVC